MRRGAKLPALHTSWDAPDGTEMSAWVPFTETCPSPTESINDQRPVSNAPALKSSEVMPDGSTPVEKATSEDTVEWLLLSVALICR